jgi:hypothetical protein
VAVVVMVVVVAVAHAQALCPILRLSGLFLRQSRLLLLLLPDLDA